MYIAISTQGKNLNSKISEEFNTCDYLLIVNLNTFEVEVIENEGNDSGEKLANAVIKYDCEAIITGKLNAIVFDILADACVTRYIGAGRSAKNAIGLMEKNKLEYIKNYNGTDECGGHVH